MGDPPEERVYRWRQALQEGLEYQRSGVLPLLGSPRYCAGTSTASGYLCQSGHCCGESGCCSYYYELWWFWLLWSVLILFSCGCAYHHRQAKQRQQQQLQRQRDINLSAYQRARTYSASMLDLSFLASLKLPSYEEVAAQPRTPPPPYSCVGYPRGTTAHLLSSQSSDNYTSCSCDSCCQSSPYSYTPSTSHASTPGDSDPDPGPAPLPRDILTIGRSPSPITSPDQSGPSPVPGLALALGPTRSLSGSLEPPAKNSTTTSNLRNARTNSNSSNTGSTSTTTTTTTENTTTSPSKPVSSTSNKSVSTSNKSVSTSNKSVSTVSTVSTIARSKEASISIGGGGGGRGSGGGGATLTTQRASLSLTGTSNPNCTIVLHPPGVTVGGLSLSTNTNTQPLSPLSPPHPPPALGLTSPLSPPSLCSSASTTTSSPPPPPPPPSSSSPFLPFSDPLDVTTGQILEPMRASVGVGGVGGVGIGVGAVGGSGVVGVGGCGGACPTTDDSSSSPAHSPPLRTALLDPAGGRRDSAASDSDLDQSHFSQRRLTGDSGIEVCRCHIEPDPEHEEQDVNALVDALGEALSNNLHDDDNCDAARRAKERSSGAGEAKAKAKTKGAGGADPCGGHSPKEADMVVIGMETI